MLGIIMTIASNNNYDCWIVLFIIMACLNLLWIFGGICAFAYIWSAGIISTVKGFLSGIITGISEKTLNKYISFTGFLYDREQDIFYSAMDAWQRKFGYCRLYDESAPLMGMIVDCEPIRFDYKGKRWLIELWKGQYDLTTGCEVGVYNTDKKDLNIPEIFSGTFYESIKNDELLHMSCTLFKNNKLLFKREDTHWWLTGFKVGEFSNPSDLVMLVSIEFLDETMRDEFVKALKALHYSQWEILVTGKTASFIFNKPHSPKPFTLTKEITDITQWKNKYLCDLYNSLTEGLLTTPQKIKAVRKQESEIFQKIKDISKTKKAHDIYKTLKPYID